MSNSLIILMTANEARAIVETIKDSVDRVGKLLLDLYNREGWRALGYASWRECAKAEFAGCERRFYQLLNAEQVREEICTIVQNSDSIPEGQLRELAIAEPGERADAETLTHAAKRPNNWKSSEANDHRSRTRRRYIDGQLGEQSKAECLPTGRRLAEETERAA